MPPSGAARPRGLGSGALGDAGGNTAGTNTVIHTKELGKLRPGSGHILRT